MVIVPRTYVIRQIDESERAEFARWIAKAERRGDLDQVEIIKDRLAQWEGEQGQEHERLACPVCGDTLLVPTARGTSRPDARRDQSLASWDRVRSLRKGIEML